MSSHPGSRLEDAIALACCLKRDGYAPEQVQDYYPTPGTASTVMYYTGINPLDGKKVYVPTDYHEKQLQRALLQYSRPENRALVAEALRKAGREDLIGYGNECLIKPQKNVSNVSANKSSAKAVAKKASPHSKSHGKNSKGKKPSAKGRQAKSYPQGKVKRH